MCHQQLILKTFFIIVFFIDVITCTVTHNSEAAIITCVGSAQKLTRLAKNVTITLTLFTLGDYFKMISFKRMFDRILKKKITT